MKTVNIKGKEYVTVNERLKYFRENFAGYSLVTELVDVNSDTALIMATIYNQEGNKVATGTSFERANNGYINKQSHVENAETSAWGRALANFGIGIDSSVASADEMVQKIDSQDQPKRCSTGDVLKITKLCKDTNTDLAKLYEHFGVQKGVPNTEQSQKMITALEKKLSQSS